jgi:CheY-like chemotaxis protein
MDERPEKKAQPATQRAQTDQTAEGATTLAGIVHDLNNLLMRIEGNLSLLLLDKPPEHKDVPYLKNAESSVERAAELLRRITESVRRPQGQGAVLGIPALDVSGGLTREPEPGEMAAHAQKGILLVEDEEIVANIGEKMLTRLDYRVWVARSGNEAIELYLQHRCEIALVILDMVIPGTTGGEIFDRLRSINPHVAVLLSSGYNLNSQAMQILNRGCRGFIQKPFCIEELKQKTSEVLEVARPDH